MGRVSFVVGGRGWGTFRDPRGTPTHEQIKAGASKVWHSDPVQNRVGPARGTSQGRAQGRLVPTVTREGARRRREHSGQGRRGTGACNTIPGRPWPPGRRTHRPPALSSAPGRAAVDLTGRPRRPVAGGGCAACRARPRRRSARWPRLGGARPSAPRRGLGAVASSLSTTHPCPASAPGGPRAGAPGDDSERYSGCRRLEARRRGRPGRTYRAGRWPGTNRRPGTAPTRRLARRAQPAAARGGAARRAAAAHRRRGGLGQTRVRPTDRRPAAARGVQPGAGPRHHLHQQGRERDARAGGEHLVGGRASHVGDDLPLGVRAHPAPRGDQVGLEVELLDLRRRRPPALMALVVREADGDLKRYPPRSFRRRSLTRRTTSSTRTPASGSPPRGTHHERTIAEAYRGYPAAAPGQRAGLRRPHHDHRPCPAGLPRCRRALPAAFPATSSSTSTRTPMSPSTSWSASWSGTVGRPARRPARAAVRRRGTPTSRCRYAFRATIRQYRRVRAGLSERPDHPPRAEHRSTQTILRAANAVIAQNSARRPKNRGTDSGDGPPIVGCVADSEHDEAAFVARRIDSLGDTDGVRPGDVAVFYRTNAQSRPLEEGARPGRAAARSLAAPASTSGARSGRAGYLRRWPTPPTTSACAGSSMSPRGIGERAEARRSAPWPSGSGSPSSPR